MQVLRRALQTLGYAQKLSRYVFIDDADWRNTQRGKHLRAEYPGQFLWVRIGHDGAREVFVPGDGGEPVDDPVRAILDALFRSPAAGTRRYGGLPRAQKPDTGWHAFELPEGTTPEDANRIAEGALGRPLDWQVDTRRRGGAYYKRWIVRDLSPEEVDRVQQALLPLKQMTEAAYAERREYGRQMRDATAFLATLPQAHMLRSGQR